MPVRFLTRWSSCDKPSRLGSRTAPGGAKASGFLGREPWAVVRYRGLTPLNRSESTCYHADQRPICELNNIHFMPNALVHLSKGLRTCLFQCVVDENLSIMI